MMRRTKAGIAVVRLHYSANPEITPEWLEKECAKYTTQSYWNLELEIEYDALGGQRVYPDFDPAIHVIPDDQIPKELTRYQAIDPHPRTPHAALWVGIDQWSDWYVYRDLWPSVVYGEPRQVREDEQDNDFTTHEYAETMALLEGTEIVWHDAETDEEWGEYRKKTGGETILYRFMDQAGKAFRASGEGQKEESYASRYDRFGIQFLDPYKSVQAGEDAIHQLLKPRRHEIRGVWPRIHFGASCREMIVELMKYRYKIQRGRTDEKELRQEGVEARCHLIDCLRYLAVSSIMYVKAYTS
mgnify:CR=1 FL=1